MTAARNRKAMTVFGQNRSRQVIATCGVRDVVVPADDAADGTDLGDLLVGQRRPAG